MSFESRNFPGDFLRHQNFQLFRQPMDGSALFRSDATFCPQAGHSGTGTSFAALNFPTRFLRHFNNTVFIASNGGSHNFDTATSWRPTRPGGQLSLDAVRFYAAPGATRGRPLPEAGRPHIVLLGQTGGQSPR